MVKIRLELEELENSKTIYVTLPCNLRAELDLQCDYIIMDSEPSMPSVYNMDLRKLNDVLDEINCENPGMTAEYLNLLLDASGARDITDEEFLRRIKENDFMFEDLSEIRWKMSGEEIAARYVATVLKVPFKKGINAELLCAMSSDIISEYIKWEDIWSQYETLGFRVEEDSTSEEYGLYLIHWRT